jgi:hypothetical protein
MVAAMARTVFIWKVRYRVGGQYLASLEISGDSIDDVLRQAHLFTKRISTAEGEIDEDSQGVRTHEIQTGYRDRE